MSETTTTAKETKDIIKWYIEYLLKKEPFDYELIYIFLQDIEDYIDMDNEIDVRDLNYISNKNDIELLDFIKH